MAEDLLKNAVPVYTQKISEGELITYKKPNLSKNYIMRFVGLSDKVMIQFPMRGNELKIVNTHDELRKYLDDPTRKVVADPILFYEEFQVFENPYPRA